MGVVHSASLVVVRLKIKVVASYKIALKRDNHDRFGSRRVFSYCNLKTFDFVLSLDLEFDSLKTQRKYASCVQN